MMVKNAKKEQPMKLKLRLCWTDAPARWAEANVPGEVVGMIGGVKNHTIPQALEDDIIAVLRKHSEPKEWEPAVVAERYSPADEERQMTALERAKQIAHQIAHGIGREWDKRLCATIERACIEHSNAELGRRRAVEARMREAASAIRLLMASEATCPNAYNEGFSVDYGIGHGHICDLCNGTGIIASEPLRLAEAALKALEGK